MLVRNATRDRATRAAARSAFTLLEILVVVAIIVVLAGIGTAYLLPQLDKSKEDIARIKAIDVGKSAETFYLQNDRYPSNVSELTQPQPNGGKPLMADDGVLDPWGKPYTIDPSGPNNKGAKPDVFTTSPSGKTIGNWGR